MSTIETMALGRSPLRVPRLGVGVMTWGPAPKAWFNPAKQAYGGPVSAGAEEEAFEAAVRLGTTLFDTAEMYSAGGSETRLGELAHHQEVFVATKFPPSPFAPAKSLPQAFGQSLVRLQRPQVDLLQDHFPTSTAAIRQVIPLLADEVIAGRARAVGVSNYSAEQMRLAHSLLAERGVPLASNQVQYSLVHRRPESNGVLTACRELGVTLIAYQPLGSGALTGKYTSKVRPQGLRRFIPPFRKKDGPRLEHLVALLTTIGARYGKTPGQVALRWLLENPVLPIPGAKNAAQVESNAGALTFGLTADEILELKEATQSWV